MDESLQLIAPGARPRLWMFGLSVLLPVGITAGALAWAAAEAGPPRLIADSMPITIPITIPITMAVTAGGIALITLVVWKVLDRAMRRHRLTLADGRLKIATSFYLIDMGIAELQLDQARVIDLNERTEYKPRWKTNGYSVPGFHSGHYRLRNRDKAFVAIVGNAVRCGCQVRADKACCCSRASPGHCCSACANWRTPTRAAKLGRCANGPESFSTRPK